MGFVAHAPCLPGYSAGGEDRGKDPGNNDSRLRLENIVLALAEFITKIPLDKVHLIGHDWGSVIAQAYAVKFPGSLKSLTVVSVPFDLMANALRLDPGQLRRSNYMAEMMSPSAERRLVGEGWLEFLVDTWSPSFRRTERNALLKNVRATFADPLVTRSSVDYYRVNVGLSSRAFHSFLTLLKPITDSPLLLHIITPLLYLLSYFLRIPYCHRHPVDLRLDDCQMDRRRVLMVCGEEDGCVSPELFKCMKDQVNVEILGGGHWCFLEEEDEFFTTVLHHVRGNN